MSYGNSDNNVAQAIIILFVMVVGGFITCSKMTGADHRSAESEFRAWAKKLNLEYQGESCNNHDSDNDGYVTCSYTDKNGEMHSVECAGSWSFQSGCRMPKPTLRVTNHVSAGR